MTKTHLRQKSLRTALGIVAGLSLLLMPLNIFASDSTVASPDSAITKEIRNLLSDYHVSGVKAQDLEGKNVEGMLKSLNDPYTVYFDSKKLQQFYSSLNNNYVGIGTRLGEDAHGVYVAEVFAGSPAEKAGLLKGDYVISVNGNSTKNAPTDSIISQVIGDKGTTVVIGIERDGAELSFTMQRDQIVLPSVTGQLIGEGVGYAKISTFSSEADEQLSKLLETFKNQGMKSLVLDLRNNPGGYVETASNILKNFLKQGKLMQVKERDGSMNEITFSEGKELDVKVFILVNSNSASASEVLTGAMQDYGLATVIGTQTYGKGSVQSLFSLSDGGAAKITIEEYFTPKLRKVNGVGLKPDEVTFGDTAQLITALHDAGVHQITLKADQHDMNINGLTVMDSLTMKKQNEHVYIPGRAAAALIGAHISWIGSKASVEVSKDGHAELFTAGSSSLLLQDGNSYIDLTVFEKLFGGLQWSDNNNQVVIETK